MRDGSPPLPTACRRIRSSLSLAHIAALFRRVRHQTVAFEQGCQAAGLRIGGKTQLKFPFHLSGPYAKLALVRASVSIKPGDPAHHADAWQTGISLDQGASAASGKSVRGSTPMR